jgi:prepilin-type N-terminal cleavage/methylation domain-containing protein
MGIARDQSGFTLVEVVISIALLGIVTAGLFTGLGTTSKVLLQTDSRQTAKNLAETCMEIVKVAPYKPIGSEDFYVLGTKDTNFIMPSIPSGYTVEIKATSGWLIPAPETRDSSIQRIIVTINGPDVTYILEDYKTK